MLEQIQQRQPQPVAIDFDPQEPYVEIADDKELQGAVARDPEEEIQEHEEQGTIWKGNVPQKILTKTARDEIRGYQEEEELIDFTARNSKKKIRDRHIISDYRGNIKSLWDWTRIVFLTKTHATRLPSDNTYRVFHQRVKHRIE